MSKPFIGRAINICFIRSPVGVGAPFTVECRLEPEASRNSPVGQMKKSRLQAATADFSLTAMIMSPPLRIKFLPVQCDQKKMRF
jgi:hypothetical protein